MKNARFFPRIGGFDLDAKLLERGKTFLDFCCPDLDDALDISDVVILATPVIEIVRILEQCIGKYPQKFYTDVGSCKTPMFEITGNYPHVRFIGGHPIAGSENKGESGWDPSLFEKKTYFYTCDNNQFSRDLEMLKDMIESVGAIPYSISPSIHDRSVALTSHLPLLASYGLMATYSDNNLDLNTFIGSGFRSMTRLTGGSPEMGKDMLISNRENILTELDNYRAELDCLAECLKNKDEKKLLELMQKQNKLYWQKIKEE